MSAWFVLSFILSLFLVACDQVPPAVDPCGGDTGRPCAQEKSVKAPSLNEARGATELTFTTESKETTSTTIAELATRHGLVEWEAYDPYYEKTKRWKTIPLLPVLKELYALDAATLRTKSFIMRASDGYSVPISGEQLSTGDAYLAVEDLDFPEWELVGEQQANPGPVYLVWRDPSHHDLHEWPRPWQLATIDLATYEQTFSRTIPKDIAKGSAVARGFELFKSQCVRCHSINQHGGKLGPELNVPQNITEYRPEEQIRAYIKNPQTFRYGSMPAFEHLEEGDLDDVIAYLKVMSTQKFDPATQEISEKEG